MRATLLALLLLSAPAWGLEQTTIDADRLEVDDAAGTATFTGNVVVVQPTLTLNAGKLVADYAKGGGGISRMTATGNVAITRKGADVPETAKGDVAVYLPATQNLTMTGAVTLTHGANVLTGDRLVYDMKAGKVNVTSQSRVRANLGGDQNKADNAATPSPAAP